METCIFCKIVKGEIPAYKVFENEATLAFLTIGPIRPGHMLVIPKKHEPDFYNLDSATYHAVMETVHTMSKLAKEKLHPKRVGLVVAGWDVPHTHVHVVPTEDSRDIISQFSINGPLPIMSDDELKQVFGRLMK